MYRAIFFDKDGVLNVDKGFEDFLNVELYKDSGETIAYFRSKGFKIFVVTNQTCIARGLITEKELKQSLKEFEKLLLQQNSDAKIDEIFYCPHHPNATDEAYRKNCKMRKPHPGMLLKAAEKYEIDLKKSYLIGDRVTDITAGYLAGCLTIQVLTEKYQDKGIESDLHYNTNLEPDFKILELNDLKRIIS